MQPFYRKDAVRGSPDVGRSRDDPVMARERTKPASEIKALEVRIAGLLGEIPITRSAALQLEKQMDMERLRQVPVEMRRNIATSRSRWR